MKWFTKLTSMELFNFWKTQDGKIENKISIEKHDNYALVTFWELGWGNKKEQKIGIPTRYKFTDFSLEFHEVYADESEEYEVQANYIAFMAEKFGRWYIADLLKSKTGISADDWLEWIANSPK